jgi:hypothetical protein
VPELAIVKEPEVVPTVPRVTPLVKVLAPENDWVVLLTRPGTLPEADCRYRTLPDMVAPLAEVSSPVVSNVPTDVGAALDSVIVPLEPRVSVLPPLRAPVVAMVRVSLPWTAVLVVEPYWIDRLGIIPTPLVVLALSPVRVPSEAM